MGFRLECLKIHKETKNKKLLKLLKPEEPYIFFEENASIQCKVEKETEKLKENFFGSNIHVTAIVGKNGCGKSSLLDILYLMINNFVYLFERGQDQVSNAPLYYVPGLCADLYYSDENFHYNLSCDDKCVVLKRGNKVGETDNDSRKYDNEIANLEIKEEEKAPILSKEKIEKIAENFFFTIVSNYSPQSFISFNYSGRVYINVSGVDVAITGSWIDGVFHRNDGYTRSIVVNPYRKKGVFDAFQEIKLSTERLCSVLIYAKQSKDSDIVGYSYNDMVISRKKGFLVNKLKTLYNANEEEREFFKKNYRYDMDVLNVIDDDFTRLIVKVFNLKKDFKSFMERMSLAYLQIKIFNVLNNYTDFSEFKKCLSYKLVEGKFFVNDKNMLKNYLENICGDLSHATTKIRRTLYFLTLRKNIINQLKKGKVTGKDYFKCLKSINFVTKRKWGNILSIDEKKFISPAAIIDCLPPSFLDYELILENDLKKKINYRYLSSGEIQLMQTLSIHAYHIDNLLSIRMHNAEYTEMRLSAPMHDRVSLKKRPEYANVNLIFDEVELCFHPDYQRRFLRELLRMIKSMGYNKNGSYDGLCINVILVTHSPFVLSDIPQSNILYLKKGIVANDDITKNPFAANVSDILHQSFFMEDGFTGEFAKERINSLVSWITNKIQSQDDDDFKWTPENAIYFIDNYIGEPLIKNCLKKMLEKEGLLCKEL